MKKGTILILIIFYSIVIQGQSMKGIYLGENPPDILPQGVINSTSAEKDKNKTSNFYDDFLERDDARFYTQSKETTSLGGETGIISFKVDKNNKVNYLRFIPSSNQITFDFIGMAKSNYGLTFDDYELLNSRVLTFQKGNALFTIDRVSNTFTIKLLAVDPIKDF
jgi:hypothetical protein